MIEAASRYDNVQGMKKICSEETSRHPIESRLCHDPQSSRLSTVTVDTWTALGRTPWSVRNGDRIMKSVRAS
jgi:hypothetical protein